MSEFSKDLEDYFCKFTFGQFVTLILLELVTLFFVFYLGARYGPDLLGSREVMAGKGRLPTEAPTVEEIAGPTSVDYTYPEVLTDPTPRDSEGAVRVKPSGITAEEYDRRKKTVLIPQEPVAATPQTASAGGDYAVQIGSYPASEEAQKKIEDWKKKGYNPFLSTGEIPNRGIWYRVRIGGFKSRDEANRYLEDFKKKEKVSALVVRTRE